MDTIEVELRPETADDFARMYWGTVQGIAASLHRQHGVVEADDIAQGIWEKALPRFEKDYKDLDAITMKRVLQRLGRDVLNRESLDFMHFSGHFVYTPAEVREKLETCAWSLPEECPDVDARLDLLDAYENLPPKQRQAVFKRYGLKEPQAEMSEAENRNVRRGVESITNYLNRGAGVTSARLDDEIVLAEVEGQVLAGMDFRH